MLLSNHSLIELEKIGKHYVLGGNVFHALKDLSLSIKKNEYIAITGPSGSGKSTLMNLLGCLDMPSSGTYSLKGKDVSRLDESTLADIRNREIGFIFQNFNLFTKMSLIDNVIQPLIYRHVPSKERRVRAHEALAKVGLSSKINHFPNEISGGQRQRVAIARALVTKPSLLLGDEPTGNLDSHTTSEIMGLFDDLHKDGQTIVLVTHELDIAAHCHRNIRIVDGEIASDTRKSEY